MGDLLRGWDDGTEVGLVAYGHRRAGDCSDIETVASVGRLDRATLIERVEGLQPTGKTPLTAAVQHAAEALRYRDNPATVAAGETFDVEWDTAVHPRDYVTIVRADAAPNEYGDYVNVSSKLEGRLTAPELPGAYEVRYVLREGRTPVGRLSVTVEAPAGSSSAGPRAWPRCRTGLPRFCSSGAELDTSGAAPAV